MSTGFGFKAQAANGVDANKPAATGFTTGFGANKPTMGGFAAQQPSLKLSDIGSELIDASIQFNARLQPQQHIQFALPHQQLGMQSQSNFAYKSGFQTQTQSKLNQKPSSNAEILKKSFQATMQQQQQIEKQQILEKTKQNISTGQKPFLQNRFGRIELIDEVEMPVNAMIKDYIDIAQGFVGMKEGSEFLTGKRAKVQLYEIYEQEARLREECEARGYQFMGYSNQIWSFIMLLD